MVLMTNTVLNIRFRIKERKWAKQVKTDKTKTKKKYIKVKLQNKDSHLKNLNSLK